MRTRSEKAHNVVLMQFLNVQTKDGKLTGLISIGDVVNQMIVAKDGQIQGLENFILGRSYIG